MRTRSTIVRGLIWAVVGVSMIAPVRGQEADPLLLAPESGDLQRAASSPCAAYGAFAL